MLRPLGRSCLVFGIFRSEHGRPELRFVGWARSFAKNNVKAAPEHMGWVSRTFACSGGAALQYFSVVDVEGFAPPS